MENLTDKRVAEALDLALKLNIGIGYWVERGRAFPIVLWRGNVLSEPIFAEEKDRLKAVCEAIENASKEIQLI